MHRSTWLFTAATLMACQEGSFSGRAETQDLPPPDVIEPEYNTDSLMQSRAPVVDVIFVVDNSCSMGEDQELLARNAPSFMEWFVGSGLDYHIGVVSTDMYETTDQGKLEAIPASDDLWIDVDTFDPVARFEDLAVLGNRGSAPERGIDTLYRAIAVEGDRYNEGFLRDGSALHAITITDEDDFSEEISHAEFIRWFNDLRPPSDRSYSAIQNPQSGASGPGYKYASAVDEIGGQVSNINEDDWADMLNALGILTSGRRVEFFLSQLPFADTIEVEVEIPQPGRQPTLLKPKRATFDGDGALLTAGWRYVDDRNSIQFYDFVPPDFATVHITYALKTGTSVEDEPSTP